MPLGVCHRANAATPGFMAFGDVIEIVGKSLDVVGVLAIVVGVAYASLLALARRGNRAGHIRFREYRQAIGRAILLGLEILVAADIIRTVAISPTFESVGVLAIIVLVRTFLSFTLEVELEGRWPWQEAAETR